MAIRATTTLLLATSALAGGTRVSAHSLIITEAKHGGTRISNHAVVALQSQAGPTRVSGHYPVVLQSIHRIITPGLLSGGVIYDVVNARQITGSILIPESNPYRPAPPSAFGGAGAGPSGSSPSTTPVIGGAVNSAAQTPVAAFMQEQTASIRQQHNITQAGDTTFSWEILTQVQPETDKQYTLGSLGRFYHQDCGLIMARYVQFASMSANPVPGSPVGFLKGSKTVDWQVTDRIELSSPDMVAGIIVSYQNVDSKHHGWITVHGALITNVPTLDSGTRAHGETVGWSATGKVSRDAPGRVLGRIQGTQVGPAIGIGALMVEIESWSKVQILAMVEPQFQDLADQIDAIQALVNAISGSSGSVGGQLILLNQRMDSLTNQLSSESARRANGDNGLAIRITALENTSARDWSLDIEALRLDLTSLITNAQNTANTALAEANRANGRLDALAPPDLTAIYAFMREILSHPIIGFPVVDGSVPPNLVYLDDGSLVWI